MSDLETKAMDYAIDVLLGEKPRVRREVSKRGKEILAAIGKEIRQKRHDAGFLTYHCPGCGRKPRISKAVELARGWRCWKCNLQMELETD